MRDVKRIEPRTLKGFRDYLPEAMMPREWLIDTARRVYRSYGFSPIDTPALEYLEILTGKGSDATDKQLYKFHDHGDRWVGLRFDLTVPLARFAATPCDSYRGVHMIGADNVDVLRDWLGMSETEVREGEEKGVLR